MSELLLVNPRRKRRVSHRRKARRMTALQRRYFGKGRSVRRRRSRRVEALEMNPKRRRRVRRRRGSTRRGIGRRFRARAGRLRGFNVNSFMRETLLPSAVGAGGALGVDVILGYLNPNLPSFMTTGIGVPLTKIAAAIGLGMAAGMVTDRRIGEQVMAGAITVVAYNYLRTTIQTNMPALTLAGTGHYMGYAGPALAFPDRLGLYVGGPQPTVPPAIAAAIAANAAMNAGKTAPGASTVGEYVSGYERDYMY